MQGKGVHGGKDLANSVWSHSNCLPVILDLWRGSTVFSMTNRVSPFEKE